MVFVKSEGEPTLTFGSAGFSKTPVEPWADEKGAGFDDATAGGSAGLCETPVEPWAVEKGAGFDDATAGGSGTKAGFVSVIWLGRDSGALL